MSALCQRSLKVETWALASCILPHVVHYRRLIKILNMSIIADFFHMHPIYFIYFSITLETLFVVDNSAT